MKVVLFSTTSATEAKMHDLEADANTLIEGTCQRIDDGDTMNGITATGKCFEWHVDDSKEVSSFSIDTTGITGLAAYTAHSPYEFEGDAHYLKDSSGADVEHVAEETSPGPSDDCKHNYWLMQMHHDHCRMMRLTKASRKDYTISKNFTLIVPSIVYMIQVRMIARQFHVLT